MHPLDYAIVGTYLLAMVAIGVYFLRRHGSAEEYFVGNRRVSWGHVGLSVVATDVGGGFSIGLGGLGFSMGISGSWLLFTGLVGAWLTAVILVPRVKTLGALHGWTTYPDFLGHHFGRGVASLAAVVSAVGYASFVGAQVLAGATLVEAALDLDRTVAVLAMAAVVIGYTALGGLEAVILTDSIQWTVLLCGLILVALPVAVGEAGGIDRVIAELPEGHLSLTNIEPSELLTWAVTIVPIWFVANTLYQRIYATRDLKSARRAWYLAGALEWPLMALIGAALGAVARVLFPELENPELALPTLIKNVLPVGVVGIVLAAYFSAIMSTADSCLLACSGHLVGDIYLKLIRPTATAQRQLSLSRTLSAAVGIASVAVALWMPSVLDAILLSYSFMVSGLLVPTLAALYWPGASSAACFLSILAGGTTAVLLQFPALRGQLPGGLTAVDPTLIAIPISAIVLTTVSLVSGLRREEVV